MNETLLVLFFGVLGGIVGGIISQIYINVMGKHEAEKGYTVYPVYIETTHSDRPRPNTPQPEEIKMEGYKNETR